MTKTKNKRKRNAPVQKKWKGGKQNVNNGAWFVTIETNQIQLLYFYEHILHALGLYTHNIFKTSNVYRK